MGFLALFGYLNSLSLGTGAFSIIRTYLAFRISCVGSARKCYSEKPPNRTLGPEFYWAELRINAGLVRYFPGFWGK